ncbi:MAG TPA: hypothetical protein VFW38_07545 [Solirubrobacteraceae bacterium]|nr:hypothetical protein [Solirubrobacteraceae bacterium]
MSSTASRLSGIPIKRLASFSERVVSITNAAHGSGGSPSAALA